MDLAKDILVAHERIQPYVLETMVEYSPWLSQLCEGEIWLKLEHLQTTGSFKLRGATNKVLSLSPEQREHGVITASTGNHGSAFAYIADKLHCKGKIYLPETVSPAKVAPMKLYDVELVYHGQDSLESETKARESAAESGQEFISPYNDPFIIAGQGTIGIELERQIPELDCVLISVGGGGLISGISTYLKSVKPDIEIIGCQPVNSPVMYESVKRGEIWEMESLPTLSDGTAGGLEAGSITFPICQALVDEYMLISEEEIQQALIWLMEKHYHLVEGAAALPIAAVLQNPGRFKGKKVGLVLCGRKIGLPLLQQILSSVGG
ncbi:MAG: threonine/serine dehydratase [Bacteroidota bacterium]